MSVRHTGLASEPHKWTVTRLHRQQEKQEDADCRWCNQRKRQIAVKTKKTDKGSLEHDFKIDWSLWLMAANVLSCGFLSSCTDVFGQKRASLLITSGPALNDLQSKIKCSECKFSFTGWFLERHDLSLKLFHLTLWHFQCTGLVAEISRTDITKPLLIKPNKPNQIQVIIL